MSRDDFKTAVSSLLESSGLSRVSSGKFDAAYVRQGRITSLVFLTADLGGEGTDRAAMKELVQDARSWCQKHVKARWIVGESGLNLVVFHDGQVSTDLLFNLPDATGMHSSILQSVTAVDCQGRTIAQAKTWIIIGKARLVLRKLAKLGR